MIKIRLQYSGENGHEFDTINGLMINVGSLPVVDKFIKVNKHVYQVKQVTQNGHFYDVRINDLEGGL